jgi:hypothetical protein
MTPASQKMRGEPGEREGRVKTKRGWCRGLAAAALASVVATIAGRLEAQPTAAPAIAVGSSDLGGVVTGVQGPEAGAWVIAETTDLPTKFVKIVVTDDRGRYLIPDLPKANYHVWVRGYGLVDSAKILTEPGKLVDLRASPAPDPAAAAQYYPAIYWYSLLEIPHKSLFPGTGPDGNGMPVALQTQNQWPDIVKTDGCYTCHQLGDKATRTLPPNLGEFSSSADAWERRIQSGQAGAYMAAIIGRLDTRLGSSCSGSGPIASPPASCRRPSRRGRKVSNGTSSSPCGKTPPSTRSRRPRPIRAGRRSGTAGPIFTIRCSTAMGVFGSRTGSLIRLLAFFSGSRIGTKSVLTSGDP